MRRPGRGSAVLVLVLAGALALGWAAAPSPAATRAVALVVNAQRDRHPISPYIYGLNFAPRGLATAIRPDIRRGR